MLRLTKSNSSSPCARAASWAEGAHHGAGHWRGLRRCAGRKIGSPETFEPPRQACGLTQEELGALVGLSNRMIAYHDRDDADPPGAQLAPLARALRVTTDELLRLAPISATMRPRTARLLKGLQQIEELPAAEQRAVLKMVDALLEHRRPCPASLARNGKPAEPDHLAAKRRSPAAFWPDFLSLYVAYANRVDAHVTTHESVCLSRARSGRILLRERAPHPMGL